MTAKPKTKWSLMICSHKYFVLRTCLNELASFRAIIISTFFISYKLPEKNHKSFLLDMFGNSVIAFLRVCYYRGAGIHYTCTLTCTCPRQRLKRMGWEGRRRVVSKILRRQVRQIPRTSGCTTCTPSPSGCEGPIDRMGSHFHH